MCGIYGFSKSSPTTRAMAPYLGIEMSSRGTDAWGCTNGEDIIRHSGSIIDSFEWPETWQGSSIFHTRNATHGSPKDVLHAHPFEYPKPDGSRIIGIHNGIIRTHNELNRKFNRTFAVDSMHIFANFAEGRGVEGVEGYGALAWYEDQKLNFCRFGTYDLHIVTLENGELVFCSLLSPIEKIAKMLNNPIKTRWAIDEYIRYELVNSEAEDTLVSCGAMPFEESKKKSTPVTIPHGGMSQTWTSGNRYTPQGYWMDENVCYICRTAKINPKEALVCEICLRVQWEEFLEDRKAEEIINATV
jgi:Glutamine amidotransferase domain